jgi:hypothetical protein
MDTMNFSDASTGYRRTAVLVGALFLAGMIIGIAGHGIVQSVLGVPNYLSMVSANTLLLAIGAMMMLLTSVGDATHGILMYPVLKQHSERIAVGYLGFRLIDAAFLGVQVLFVLFQIPLGREYALAGIPNTEFLQSLSTIFIQTNVYAYQIGMIFLSFAGLMLCYAFLKAKLVPTFVAVWGLIGYATILTGSVVEVLGSNLNLVHTLPGGLWELFIGVWLLAKGFKSTQIEA